MTATARMILKADADGTPAWLAQRTQGFGGTDAANLYLGHTSAFALWREKKGLATEREITPELQALFDYGHSREPELARIFTDRTGLRVRNTGTWARKDQPWALANPDRLVGPDGILEIKTTGAYTDAAKDWRDGRVNPRAWVQAHWYAYVTGRNRLYFIAEVDRVPHVLGPYDRDELLIQELEDMATDFWSRVEQGAEPDPTPQDATHAYPTAIEGKTVAVDPWSDTLTDLDRLRLITAQIKDLEAEKKHLTQGIQLELGDAEALIDTDGRVLATWKSQTRKGALDTKALAADGIDVDAYRKPATTTRTFLVKETNR